MKASPRKFRCQRRCGYTLIFFALFVFGLFALAALVIDVGFVRLTQRQMQTAVDGAALEGLRSGRQEANKIVEFVFDDDLDGSNGDLRNFGAGPVLNFEGGLGDPSLAASLLIKDDPAQRVYKPVRFNGNYGLETNEVNVEGGDMEAGVTDDNRPKFTTRMKRSNEPPVDGISSSGPPVPFLFGRGSLIQPEVPGGPSPRQLGTTVRATAIAEAQRVKSVGRANAASNLPGALPFVILRSSWEASLTEGNVTTVIVDGTGNLLAGLVIIGQVTDPSGQGILTSLGEDRPPVATPAPADFVINLLAAIPGSGLGYVPIIADSVVDLPANRVVGFGHVDQLAIDPNNSAGFVLRKRSNRVAAENASATLATPLDSIFSDEPDDPQFAELWEQHRQFQSPLLAPALVR